MSPFEQAFDYLRQNRPQGRFMGGSTGARGYDLPMGQFVGKRGDSPAHIQNEYDMNRFLNELGVPVPQAQMQDGLMLTQMEEGQQMGFQPTAGDIRQLTRDFVPHATIANWDMLGLGRDNVIRRPDGTLSYVDVGGAGAFRAQGAPKVGHSAPRLANLTRYEIRIPNWQVSARLTLAGLTTHTEARMQ